MPAGARFAWLKHLVTQTQLRGLPATVIFTSLMCGMDGEHMAATRLGSLAQVYGSRRNQTRKRMPTGLLASLPCTSACLDVRVFFSKWLLHLISQHLSARAVASEVRLLSTGATDVC